VNTIKVHGGMHLQLHSLLNTSKDEVSRQLRAPAALPPGNKALVLIKQEVGWPKSCPGHFGKETNLQVCWELNTSSDVCPISQLLYRLEYFSSHTNIRDLGKGFMLPELTDMDKECF
jgi:hypothetical protein